MKKININGKKVEIYDSIDELPVIRFHKYNKYLIIDTGVGADLNSVDNHIERAIRYIAKSPNDAILELQNLRQTIYMISQELSTKHLAFATLVKSINGKERDDLSDEGIRETLSMINDIKLKEADQLIETVKKKIDDELTLYFPGLFDDARTKEFYDELKRRTILILDEIITGNEKGSEIDKITNMLITFAKPKSFTGSESVEISYNRQFEDMCLLLSQNLHINPKSFTVLEFYNSFMFLKQQLKSRERANK